MTLEILTDSQTVASAGDNYLFSEKVPSSEIWILKSVSAMNATNICVCRLEILDPAGHIQILKTHHQGRVTNFEHLQWNGDLELPGGWQFRVLITYCSIGDSIDGQALYDRRVVTR